MDPLILASGSLRRQEYLRLLGIPFSIMVARGEETLTPGLSPREQAEQLAEKKVNEVIDVLKGRLPPWIVGADTVVTLDGEIFGKPKDREDAKAMLSRFRGREHTVVTAAALFNGQTRTTDIRSQETAVVFSRISDDEIEWYLNTGEWQGVAGAYKIQGMGACFISEIRGSYSSVVGLPIHDFYVMLRENGYPYGA
ncbi:Maf family protein [Breznakiella homolactica]|uniref:dTTP/UTP pyrophosphatase n=1 Tax=Breznakiella homolactica TaxID=2798577 RepID=A0A7T8B9L9_9SPIR|nr:Maf family protein [Breznakiella homolactica]QQO08090.1 Maf family protein [Breznakiella homolactica]